MPQPKAKIGVIGGETKRGSLLDSFPLPLKRGEGYRVRDLSAASRELGVTKMKKDEKKVADMTVSELIQLVGYAVDQALEDYFGDPDEGLELRPEIVKKLMEQRKSRRKRISHEEVVRTFKARLEE